MKPRASSSWLVISETSSCSVNSFEPSTMVCATADEHTTAETAALVRTAKSFNRAIMDYATALLRTPGGVAPYPPNFRSTPVAIAKCA